MNVSVAAPAGLALCDQRPGDRLAVRRVVEAAFGRADEAGVGHVLYLATGRRDDAGFVPGAALAPLAVHPAHQRREVDGTLVRHGLARCREAGVPCVVVLGDPA